ncbi:MAG: cytochrome d ubiquinol oxidase subunit II [Candidatus Krumholzibacteriia bacterium]|nr:cytochrome d ubiquinol oxidase subunit II [bacterium]MCB9516851.1 cytochrome d ubiquinol oxidase subunit II [Candidatus Latescibacterota bacterium]
MEALWYGIAAMTLAIYVVMDGFDFGAGALHLWIARRDAERRQVLAAIGPFWDGNEVWLLAAGGVLFLAFPRVLAAGLSGFYLAIMLVLWLLILRGIAIEFRSHLADGMWRSLWDAIFALASTLLPVLFGAALGNLLRGVPLAADGWFALTLFASFSPRGELGILDWYTVLAGVLALVALAHHGALFLAWKTDGDVQRRSRRAAAGLFPALLPLWLLGTVATFSLNPALRAAVTSRPLAWLAGALLLVGLALSGLARRAGRDLTAFLGSAAFLLGVLGATAASLYPVLIRAAGDATLSLDAAASAASRDSLTAALGWWPAGLALALVYIAMVFRLHRGKVSAAPVAEEER